MKALILVGGFGTRLRTNLSQKNYRNKFRVDFDKY